MSVRFLLLFLFFANSLFSQSLHFTNEELSDKSKANLEEKFTLSEILEYNKAADKCKVFLENGYASAIIKNPDDWQPPEHPYKVTEVNLIYTKYPVDKKLWRTNYRKLLTDRLKELFKLDSTLNSDETDWNIVLQTKCKNEPQAMLLPHGIEIVYELLQAENKTENTPRDTITVQPVDSTVLVKKAEKQIDKFISRHKFQPDSTVWNVFDRHKEWKKSLVVIDWTGSMQGFGAQLMLWFTRNFDSSGIKYIVVFNDLNWHDKNRKPGNFGGIYFAEATDLNQIVKIMKKARNQATRNNDTEENNIEALLKAVNRFNDFDELIMIADNRSCMKDYCLSDSIKVPVKIILCGTQRGINPQYVNLAYKTNGSLHTIESDIYNLKETATGERELRIDNSEFKFNEKKNRYVVAGKKPKRAYQNSRKFYKTKCE